MPPLRRSSPTMQLRWTAAPRWRSPATPRAPAILHLRRAITMRELISCYCRPKEARVARESLTLKEAQPPWLSLEETRSLFEVLVILAAYSQGMVRDESSVLGYATELIAPREGEEEEELLQRPRPPATTQMASWKVACRERRCTSSQRTTAGAVLLVVVAATAAAVHAFFLF